MNVPYSYYLIIDLEGTCCDDNSIPPDERETIEIGAVLLDAKSGPLCEYARVVRPIRHPVLTAYCTQLTTITQEDVDAFLDFKETWLDFLQWLDRMIVAPALFCSWGKYDIEQLTRDCTYHGLQLTLGQHCNLARMFQKHTGRHVGHRKAMNILRLKPVGTHHRGLDDARNIAEIFKDMMQRGWNLESGM